MFWNNVLLQLASYSVCFYAWHVDDDVVKMIIKLSW